MYGCRACTDCAEILDKVDAVTIATPTTTHLQIAKPLLYHRIPVLIEKPLASSVREGRKIVSLARRRDTVVAVGHSERCNPVVQAMKRFSIEPKFIEAHRVSPYPFRSTDVGVVLDLMIHDIDIVLSLANSKIGGSMPSGSTSSAVARHLHADRFDNGCVATSPRRAWPSRPSGGSTSSPPRPI
jgi:predicted dehydrogenase